MEDDRVIKRIPVYFNPHYLNSLVLLQYPDRPARPDTEHPLIPPTAREQGKTTITTALKPASQILRLQVPLETNPVYYNQDQAKEYGKGLVDPDEPIATTGKRSRKVRDQPKEQISTVEKKLEKMTLESTLIPDSTNYAIGVINEDGIHLNPVTTTMQLRPKLEYLDHIATIERRAKRDAMVVSDDEDNSDQQSDTELKKAQPRAVQVSVKQAPAASEKPVNLALLGSTGTGRGDANLFAALRLAESEKWASIRHYSSDTPQAEVAFEHMLVHPAKQDIKLISTTSPSQYLSV